VNSLQKSAIKSEKMLEKHLKLINFSEKIDPYDAMRTQYMFAIVSCIKYLTLCFISINFVLLQLIVALN
jgi:hypothetical protein